jgi:hypothetical protein
MAAVGLGDITVEEKRDYLARRILSRQLDSVRLVHTWLCPLQREGARVSLIIVLEAAVMGKQALADYRSDHPVRAFQSRCNICYVIARSA